MTAWEYRQGIKAKEAKNELLNLAMSNLRKQDNYVVDKETGNASLKIGNTIFRVTKNGLFHNADRSLISSGNAIATIGDILNSSVEIPGIELPWHYRIAEVDFGTPAFVLVTAKEVPGGEEIVDLQTLYSVNVKANGAARDTTHTNTIRPTEDSIANLRDAWQRLFKPGIDAHNIAKRDAEYLDAVKRGDMETAQRMVREAAAKAMPNTKVVDENGDPLVVYHGTNAVFNIFNGGAFFTDDYMNADGYASGERVIDAYVKMDRPLVIDAQGRKWDDLATPYGKTTREIAENADREKYDGVIFRNINDNWIDDEEYGDVGTVYYPFNPSAIKSADPMTYDDAGNVIPLSQRFNKESNDIRYSIGGLYTGSAADYAERVPVLDKDGNVTGYSIGNGPSLQKIGTGEGGQVYGWGLYASDVRGVAEGYASNGADGVVKGILIKGRRPSSLIERNAQAAIIMANGDRSRAIDLLQPKSKPINKIVADFQKSNLKTAEWIRENYDNIEVKSPEYIYEQTFFTNRAPGDESHLLKWYEPVSEENLDRIRAQITKEHLDADTFEKRIRNGKGFIAYDGRHVVQHNGQDVYSAVQFALPKDTQNLAKAASEFLARADIDGIKYPVDSYGKTIKDGDKAGWNYVSFRDDNIRVDHKWVDGVQRYSIGASVNALADIANGKEYGVLHNDKYGEVRYPLGRMGKGGMGFLHIVEQRIAKDGASIEEAIDTAIRVGVSAQIGTETEQRHNTHHLDWRGTRAIIGEMPDKTIVITGYEIDTEESVVAKQRAAELSPHPHVRSEEVTRALKEKLASTSDIVPQSGAEVNGGVRWSVSAAMLDWADSLPDASTTRSSVESGLPALPYSPDSYVAAMVAGDKLVGNVRNPDEYKRLAKVLGSMRWKKTSAARYEVSMRRSAGTSSGLSECRRARWRGRLKGSTPYLTGVRRRMSRVRLSTAWAWTFGYREERMLRR